MPSCRALSRTFYALERIGLTLATEGRTGTILTCLWYRRSWYQPAETLSSSSPSRLCVYSSYVCVRACACHVCVIEYLDRRLHIAG